MGEVAQEAHKGPALNQSREQRIEIATRLMEAWSSNTESKDPRNVDEMAKECAKAALTIQREA